MNLKYFTFAFLFIFLLSDYGIYGVEVGFCSTMSLTINAYSNFDNQLVYMYMADLNLSPADPYYTNITVSRQFAWSSDPSLYYQNVSSWPGCAPDDESCSFIYEDGVIWQSYNVMMAGELVSFELMTWFMIDQGTYYGLYETFDPKKPPCIPDVGGNANFSGRYTYCCKKYTYFTIPDVDPNPCLELSGVTTFYDSINETLSIFETNYQTTPDVINFTITGNLISGDRIFYISPNYFGGCGGSAEAPSCSMLFPLLGNYQVDMYFYSYYASDKYWASQFIMNKFIRRNGIFMQNQSQPFTPENPCTPILSPPDYYGQPSKTSLCCTRFQHPSDSDVMVKQKLQKIVDDAKMQNTVGKRISMPGKRLPPRDQQQPQKQLKQRRIGKI